MVEEHEAGDATASSRLDEHKFSGFIYGTVTGMVAIAGLSGGHAASWLEAAVVIVVGAVTIWVAHAYSALFSKRVYAEHRLDAHELGETLAGSWPIVTAGGDPGYPVTSSRRRSLVARLRLVGCKLYRRLDPCARRHQCGSCDQGDLAAPCSAGRTLRRARARDCRCRVFRALLGVCQTKQTLIEHAYLEKRDGSAGEATNT
jgi:hypothetical protein